MKKSKSILVVFLVLGIVMLIVPSETKIKYNFLQMLDNILNNKSCNTSGESMNASKIVGSSLVEWGANTDKDALGEESANPTESAKPAESADAGAVDKPEVIPKIVSMGYNSEYFAVNKKLTLTQVISECNHTDIDRSYYVEIYSSRPYGDFMVAENNACIPIGQTSVQIDNSFFLTLREL